MRRRGRWPGARSGMGWGPGHGGNRGRFCHRFPLMSRRWRAFEYGTGGFYRWLTPAGYEVYPGYPA
jgi:hypothetical protein